MEILRYHILTVLLLAAGSIHSQVLSEQWQGKWQGTVQAWAYNTALDSFGMSLEIVPKESAWDYILHYDREVMGRPDIRRYQLIVVDPEKHRLAVDEKNSIVLDCFLNDNCLFNRFSGMGSDLQMRLCLEGDVLEYEITSYYAEPLRVSGNEVIGQDTVPEIKSYDLHYFMKAKLKKVVSVPPADQWTAFRSEETELIGFKNAAGTVMIEPKFMGFTMARAFDNIIAVMEETEGGYQSYYLTKSGRRIGNDSLHIVDNGADCESEGYIRFRDKQTDQVGLFGKDGQVAIPANYNELSRVHNGLIWALRGAEKEYWDNHHEAGCNHYNWKGGQVLLLNTKQEVLIDQLDDVGQLDLYSLQIQSQPSTDTTMVSLKGTNGQYYIFKDTKRDFKHWLYKELLQDLTSATLATTSMDSITYWGQSEQWETAPRQAMLSRNFVVIRERLQSIQATDADFFITTDGLNPYMYEGEQYLKYFNTCGEAKEEQYPVLSLIINDRSSGELQQDHFEFLKTETGYRLIGMTVRNGALE